MFPDLFIAFFWKAVPGLLWPVLKKFFRPVPRLGFVRLVTLHRSSVQPALLNFIASHLSPFCPLKITEIYVDTLQLRVGVAVGVRLKLSGLKVKVEWTGPDVWKESLEAIQKLKQQSSMSAAKSREQLVTKHINPKGVVPGLLAKVIDRFVSMVDVQAVGIEFWLCGEDDPIILTVPNATVKTSECGVIEPGGALAKMKLCCGVRVGKFDMLSDVHVGLVAQIPRVFRTILVPLATDSKRINANVAVENLVVSVCPEALSTILRGALCMNMFLQWSQKIGDEVMARTMPLTQYECVAYEYALTSRWADVTLYEERMTCDEILDVRRRVNRWPVPQGVTLNTWLRQLSIEQRPLVGLGVKLGLKEITARALSGTVGHSVIVSLQEIHVECTVNTAAQEITEPQQTDRTHTSSVAWRKTRTILDVSVEDAGRDRSSFLPQLSLLSSASVRSLRMSCDNDSSLAMPVLEPCCLDAHVNLCMKDGTLVSELSARVFESMKRDRIISSTLSSRSLWQISSVVQGLRRVVPQFPQESPEEKCARLTRLRKETFNRAVADKFALMDTDGSGALNLDELVPVVCGFYAELMTEQEMQMATESLFSSIASNGAVTLHELQNYFNKTMADTRVGYVVLRFEEFTRYVPPTFDALHAFRTNVMCGRDEEFLADTPPKVLQIRWIRSLYNYEVARQSWADVIVPRLGLTAEQAAWLVKGSDLAYDFWNSPITNLVMTDSMDSPFDFDIVVNLELIVDGICAQLADSQHVISCPRVSFMIQHMNLRGGIRLELKDGAVELCGFDDLQGGLSMQAQYVNDRDNTLEPVLEPCEIMVKASDTIWVQTGRHFVVNVTPPLMRALLVAAGSLQQVTMAAKEISSHQEFTLAWVTNNTAQDLVIQMEHKGRRSKPMDLIKGQSTTPLQVAEDEAQGLDDKCLLAVSSRTHVVHVVVSVTGRRVYSFGNHTLVVDVSVDVNRLAPVVSFGTMMAFRNFADDRTVQFVDMDGRRIFDVAPRSTESGEVSSRGTVVYEVDEAGERLDELITIPAAGDAYLKEFQKMRNAGGYRIQLLNTDEFLNSSAVMGSSLIFVPMLRIQNALPGEMLLGVSNSTGAKLEGHVAMDRMRPADVWANQNPLELIDLVEHERLPYALQPGNTKTISGLDSTLPIIIGMEFGGVRYAAYIQAGRLATRQSVMMRARYDQIECHSVHNDAVILTTSLEWSEHTALLSIYSRYLVANKSSYDLEVSTAGKTVMSSLETVRPVKMKAEAWDDATTPQLALLDASKQTIFLQALCVSADAQWSWDTKNRGSLEHWPEFKGEPTSKSGAVNVRVSNDTDVAEMTQSDGSVLTLGVSITDMSAPFDRSNLVTVVPRYVVMNRLDRAVKVWPANRRSLSMRESVPPSNIPVVRPQSSVALDSIRLDTSVSSVAEQFASTQRMVSVRVNETFSSGADSWSPAILIDVVGDTVFTLVTTYEDGSQDVVVVRASVEVIDATVFIVFNPTPWPFCIENRSVTHSLTFSQEGAYTEMTVPPHQHLNLVLEDPHLPPFFWGRILGAGKNNIEKYDLQDSSHVAQKSLYIPDTSRGSRHCAMRAHLESRYGTLTLVFSEALDNADATSERSFSRQHRDIFSDLGLNVMLTGFHVCLIDSLIKPPMELLGITVDYVQLEKSANSRSLEFKVHHVQVDDLGVDSPFIFGPSNSGFNTPPSDDPSGKCSAVPWLWVHVDGAKDPNTSTIDMQSQALTLQCVEVRMRTMNVNFDAVRLSSIGAQVFNWLQGLGAEMLLTPTDGSSLTGHLGVGIRVPNLGFPFIFNIGNIDLRNIAMNAHVQFVSRGDERDGSNDPQDEALGKLWTKLISSLPGAVQTLINTIMRSGASFAEVAPRFLIDKFEKPNVSMTAGPLASQIGQHYTRQLIAQWLPLVTSMQWMGDPGAVYMDVRGGFSLFIEKVEEREIIVGIGELGGGLCAGGFGAISKMSGALSDLFGGLVGRPGGSHRKPDGVADGVDMAMDSLVQGITLALNGIVDVGVPREDEELTNWILLLRTMQGTVGLVARPLEGMLGSIEKLTEGFEAQARSSMANYVGLRRPPRFAFNEVADGFPCLDEVFFWPSWRLRVTNVYLPALWREPVLRGIVVTLVQADSLEKTESEITLFRGLQDGVWVVADPEQGNVASGRIGSLRGPFQLQVDALLEGSIALTKPLRATVGVGSKPVQVFRKAMSGALSREDHTLEFTLSVVLSPLLVSSSPLQVHDELGTVTAEFAPLYDECEMPRLPQRLPSENRSFGGQLVAA